MYVNRLLVNAIETLPGGAGGSTITRVPLLFDRVTLLCGIWCRWVVRASSHVHACVTVFL